jgi:hypothetical protein
MRHRTRPPGTRPARRERRSARFMSFAAGRRREPAAHFPDPARGLGRVATRQFHVNASCRATTAEHPPGILGGHGLTVDAAR